MNNMRPITITSVDEGLGMMGGYGLYQKLVTLVLILGYMTGELIV